MAKPKPKPIKKLGRESQLKDPCRQAILDAIELGCNYTEACAVAGIGYSTFRSWMQHGRADAADKLHSAFSSFLADIKKAQAEFVQSNLRGIKEIAEASNNWTARAWLLERNKPERFGLRAAEIRALIAKGEEQDKKIAELTALLKSRSVPEPAPVVEETTEGG